MTLLISACLLGCPCRFDGKSKTHPAEEQLMRCHTLIPFCPEIYGGLPTPRPPAECRNGRVFNKNGEDVTEFYARGAAEALRLAERFGCTAAVLKARSPSCGRGAIYDGTFTGTLVPGDGVTAALLKENGIPVYTEEELDALLKGENRP